MDSACSPWKKVKKLISLGLCLFRTLEYDMIFFQKYTSGNTIIHWDIGTVISCQKGTGSVWEIFHNEKFCFLQSIYLQCRKTTVDNRTVEDNKYCLEQ